MRKRIHLLYENFKKSSFKKKLFSIITIHFILCLIGFVVFFLDDYSALYQIIYSAVHLSFFMLLIDSIYRKESDIWIGNRVQKVLLALFIIINVVPFFQPFLMFDDTPFTARWEIFPQTKFGFPFTYLRLFSEEAQQMYQGGNPPIVFHINSLFYNLYLFGLVTIVVLKFKRVHIFKEA